MKRVRTRVTRRRHNRRYRLRRVGRRQARSAIALVNCGCYSARVCISLSSNLP